MKKIIKKKFIASTLLFLIIAEICNVPLSFASSIFSADSVNSSASTVSSVDGQLPKPSDPIIHWGIVAILVDDDLMNNTTQYEGLSAQVNAAGNKQTPAANWSEVLKAKTLADRIRRYGLDVQGVRPFTRSIIIKVKKNETVPNIANALERLYMEGDMQNANTGALQNLRIGTTPVFGSFSKNETSKLTGVVLIGNVPLPVVNKNGNRFVSLLPYTDFKEKAYIFDSKSNDYLPNKSSISSQPEIWNGVIKPPVKSEEGNKLLAEYFDKNYLFHCATTSCLAAAQFYKAFTKKMLYTDFLNEFKQMSKNGFANYLRYIKYFEDIYYSRWSKFLGQKTLQESTDQNSPADAGGLDGLQPNDYDPDMDSKKNDDPAGETVGNYVDGKMVPDGCPGACGRDEDGDSIDSDNDGFPDGYEREYGSDDTCLVDPWVVSPITLAKKIAELGPIEGKKAALASDPKDPDVFPLKCFPIPFFPFFISKRRTSPSPNPAWWVDEGVNSHDRPFNYTKNGTDCSAPNVNTANCAGNPADDDEDSRIDEEADAVNHPNDHQNHFKAEADPETFAQLPDALNQQIIEQVTGSYNSLFDKFKANIGDWTGFTGRYNPSYTDSFGKKKSDVSTIPALVTMKDEFTGKYLRSAADAIERKIDEFIKENPNNVFLENPIILSQESKINLTVNVDTQPPSLSETVFVNFANHPFSFTNIFGNVVKTVDYLYINGMAADKIKSVKDCSLYRGSNGPVGSNSSMVFASHLLNGSIATESDEVKQKYAGCILENKAHPEFCFPDKATLPIFDPIGTKKVTGILDSAVDYRACSDMREKKGYIEYLAQVEKYLTDLTQFDNSVDKALVEKPRDPHTPADKVILFEKDISIPAPPATPPNPPQIVHLKVTLDNLLKIYGAIDGIDNNGDGTIDEAAEASPMYALPADDNLRMGAELLQKVHKEVTLTNTYPDPNNLLLALFPELLPDQLKLIKTVIFSVTPQPALDVNGIPITVSTFDDHKEPTADTLLKQTEGFVAPIAMPIDNPRYVSFRDKNGLMQKVLYPNLFQVTSMDSLVGMLRAKEAELIKIAKDSNIDIKIDGQLTGIIDGSKDSYSDLAREILYRADKEKIKDALEWKQLNIDEKHDYITGTYLDPKKNAFIGETANGYESMYMVSNGDANSLYMNFNADIPEVDSDPRIEQTSTQEILPKTQPGQGSGGGAVGQNGQPGGGGESDSGENYAVNILLWFGEIVKWVGDIATLAGGAYKSEPVCSASEKLSAEAEKNADPLTAPPVDFSVGDFMNVGPAIEASKETSKLRLSTDKNVLRSGASTTDFATVTVEGLSTNGDLNAEDSMTKVFLKVKDLTSKDVVILNPTSAVNLSGGKASFRVLSTEIEGQVSITAISPERSELGVSNEIKITSTGKTIRISTYHMVASPQYKQSVANGFVIKETTAADSKIIAYVDGKTGMVNITDIRYDLLALPAHIDKPARLGVREKLSGTIIASVYFAADKTKAVALDSAAVDFLKKYTSLEGVHVKDLDNKDQFSAVKVAQTAESNAGGVYLFNNEIKIGIVDTAGNIFIKPGYKFNLKTPENPQSPVVFVAADSRGKSLFEFYSGIKEPKISIEKEEGDYKDFNLLALRDGLMMLVAHAADAAKKVPGADIEALTDLQKILLGLDFRKADNNGNGVDDNKELANNMDPGVQNKPLFTDLTPATKGFNDVIRLFKRSIITGYQDGSFQPARKLSREEFVKLDLGAICVSCSKFNLPIKKGLDAFYNQSPFPDKNITPELLYCVKEAKYEQIVSGYKGGEMQGYFLPLNAISRAEATKVVEETLNRQLGITTPVIEAAGAGGKPWYYNYVLAAQKDKLYPSGVFAQLDSLDPGNFKMWFDQQIIIPNNEFIKWITGEITRIEFATMVSRFIDKYDCFKQDADGDGIPDNLEKYIFGTSPTKADTDGGGVLDFDEIKNGTNPLDAKDDKNVPSNVKGDTDGGGVLDVDEIKNGTNPFDAGDDNSVTKGKGVGKGGAKVDDNDGLPADWETKYGLNPYDPTDANKDIDGDGLTNLEEFKLGTDPSIADTDGGGVNDGDEVIRGTDPLNPADDLLTVGGGAGGAGGAGSAGGAGGGYIVGNTVDDNYTLELIDNGTSQAGEEIEFTTEMPVWDNALPNEDNLKNSTLFVEATLLDETGTVMKSDSKTEITFGDAEYGGAFAVIDPTSVYLKEGKALTRIKAGTKSGNYSIKASAKLNGMDIPSEVVMVTILPLEPAPFFEEAASRGITRKVTVPVLRSDSPILKSGGLSTTTIYAELRDKNGNLCTNQMYQLTFNITGEGTLDQSLDEMPDLDGVQISSMEGIYNVVLTSAANPGDITVTATYQIPPPNEEDLFSADIGVPGNTQIEAAGTQQSGLVNLAGQALAIAKTTFNALINTVKVKTRNDLKVIIKSKVNSLPSDYTSSTQIDLEVTDLKGATISDFRGEAQFSLANDKLGSFSGDKKQAIINGRSSITFGSTNLSGDAVISAIVPGFDATTITIKILPKASKKIILEADNDLLEASPKASMEIRARLYDTDGNFADNDSTTQVKFSLSKSAEPNKPDSGKFAKFAGNAVEPTVTAVNGIAKIILLPKDLTGPINIFGEAAGLQTGLLSVSSIKKFYSTQFKDLAPHILYASMLGADFGNVFKDDYMAGWFVFSGEAQAASTLISPPKPKAHILEINANGKINLVDATNFDTKVIPNNGTDQRNRILIYDTVTKNDLAEIFMIIRSAASKAFIVDDTHPLSEDNEGVYVEQISTSSDYRLIQNSGAISIIKNGNEAVKILDNGDIQMLNIGFQLMFTPSEEDKYLTININESGAAVVKVTFVTKFANDAGVLKKDDMIDQGVNGAPAGTYVRLISARKNIGYDRSFSGNSSALPQGIIVIDKDTDLSSDQAPGQQYPSLEKGGEVEGIGFTGENKHMLLFSAGNTVGESNLPYASEIGVVIGDPTILQDNRTTLTTTDKAKSMVFTKDIGQEIFMGSEPIQEMVPIDYNSDGLKDLLAAYKNGEVRLLQNNNAYPKFEDRGLFLNFPNGILSMAAGDFNKDGQEDLIIANTDSCRSGEICIDEYVNHGGNFERKHLNLKSFTEKNRVYMIRVADMNGDGYPEIITSDDIGQIRVFWNNKGEVEQEGQLLGNLGIRIDNTASLKSEVAVYYEGITGAPVNQTGEQDDQNFKRITLQEKQGPPINDPKAAAALAQAAIDAAAEMDANLGNAAPTPADSNAKSSQKTYDFIKLDLDSNLGLKSEKSAKDLTPPLNLIARDDLVEYAIKLTNGGSAAITNLMVSDVIPGLVSLDKESIKCPDCSQALNILDTGMSARPFVFSGISLPAGATRTIKYTVTVGKTPKVKITIGNDFEKGYPSDKFLDIAATPEGNTTGRMVYFYPLKLNYTVFDIWSGQNKTYEIDPKTVDPQKTNLDLNKARVQYTKYVTPPPPPPDPEDPNTRDFGAMAQEMTVDANGNGLPDPIEKILIDKKQADTVKSNTGGDALDQMGDDLEHGINDLTCKGGCLPLPINYAFLAPGLINGMGLPFGLDLGLPVFAVGIPSLIPIWPPSPYQASIFRLYLSPTLTGRLGIGMCLGTWMTTGMCMAFATPLPGLPQETCDKINAGINSVLAGAQNAAKSISGELATSSDAGATGAGASGQQETGGFSSTADIGNYHVKVGVSTNFRVPGFPSVITEWLDRQSEEIITKLTDLSDLYVFLPNPISVAGAIFPQDGPPDPNSSVDSIGKKFMKSKDQLSRNPKTWLSFLNSIPLIQIVPQDVLFKIPALTTKEIRKLQNDWQQWMIDERQELNKALRTWSCDNLGQFDETLPYKEWKLVKPSEAMQKELDSAQAALNSAKGEASIAKAQANLDAIKAKAKAEAQTKYSTANATICEKLILDMTNLTSKLEQNIQILNKWKEFPRQILAWRSVMYKYINQIICYLDAIVKYIGGYIVEQQKRIEAWIEAFRVFLQQLKDFKIIFDLMIDYNASCDKCSTSRFSLFELLLKLFLVIPSPPIIVFPKWPDIYFDLSDIQAGIKIMWPDLRFRPEPIILPKIPRIYLPSMPSLTIVLPEIPLLPEPPALGNLPDLPPLPLPSLPNLPPPPKLPKIFPASIKVAINILKKILRILCLLKKGLIFVPESGLKAQIEQMTERSLSLLLPFDLGLNIQFPPMGIDWGVPSKIEIASHLNFQLELDFILKFVQNIADKSNSITTDFVKWLNDKIKELAEEAQKAADAANNAANQSLGEDTTVNLTKYAPQTTPKDAIKMIGQLLPDLAGPAKELFDLNDQIAKEAAEYKKYALEIKDFHLKATQRFLTKDDPILNRPLAAVKNGINSEIPAQFEMQTKAMNLRKGLIAYVENRSAMDTALNSTTDFSEFGRLIAMDTPLTKYLPETELPAQNNKMVAAIDPIIKSSTGSQIQNGLSVGDTSQGRLIADIGDSIQKDIKSKLHLLADVSIPDVPTTPGMQSSSAVPIGIFITDPATGVSERLINYTAESDSQSQLAFMDVNNDGDNDIIFAMGGNIYMKENYKIADTSNPKYLRTINRITPKVAELNDYLPKAPAVNGFSTTYSNNKSAELSWDYAGDNAGGYEIIFNTAPDAFDQNLGIKVHKVGAIPGGEPVAEDVPADAVFQPETIEIPQLLAESIYGNVTFDGAERIFLKAGDTPAKVISPQIVHTLGDSEISINNNGSDEGGIKLPANRTFVIPSEYTETVEISVISGSVEIINPRIQQQGQTLQNGMLLDFNDVIMTESGTGATVRINSGPYISIRNGEDLLLKQLNTPENPSVELILPNGFYYSKIYAFDKAGFRSTVSYLNLMAPSICSDKQDPVINAGPIERSVSIYKSLKIDTSSSFDANGEILAYWLDTDTSVDSDGDGDPTNDKNMAGDLDPKTDFDGDGITFNDRDNPVFNLKPYTDLNKRQVAANIIDESNNRSSQLINITVFVPDVILADSTATEGVIRGVIDPIDNMIPISLIRNRKGSISKIITAKAKNDGKYYTDNIGEFAADDLKLIDTVVIKNAKGEVIGEINPETGRIILYDKNYSTEVLPAEKPLLPTRVIVKDKDGNVLATIFLVPDVNTDTTVDDPNLPYDSGTTAIFNGVHSKDIDVLDDFEFSKIAMDDANFPGATEIVEKSTQKRAAILDTGGNFYAIDNRLSLQLKSAVDLDAPMAVEIVFTADVNTPPKVIGEFVVSVHSDKGVQVLPADKYNLMAVKASSKDPMFDTDHDGIPDQWEITYGLNPKDPADAQLDSDGDGLSNLEEYKVGSNPLNPDSNGNGMNDALELINGHNPNDKTASPFTDVKEDNQYYKSIMNLFLRNVLKGIPAGRGLLFGPGQPFTRAEFAKLMLDIFCIIPRKEAYEAPSAFTDIKYTLGKNPWYYASVKEAYFQGFITGYLGEIDPATGKSPFKADNTISKAEVVKVILEALQRRGIIDMGRVPVIEPWYKPYMEISLDLKPYLKEKSFLRQVYILTPEEAKNPEEPITRALFIAMADRVLTAYDCSAVDDDGDGMPSYWERLHGLNPNDPSDANDDPDKDGLTNLQEYQHGSDPWNFDTDGGGVGDGTEVKTGTNPLNPKDDKVDSDNDGIPDKSEIANGLNPKNPADANNDPDGDGITNLQEYGHNTDPNNPDTDGDGLKDGAEVNIHETDPTNPDTDSGGINDGTEVKTGTNPIDPKDDNFDVKSELTEGPYAVLPACLSCPCPATIEHTADLIPGDIIFANISSYDDLTIFAQSNKITIQTVPKL